MENINIILSILSFLILAATLCLAIFTFINNKDALKLQKEVNKYNIENEQNKRIEERKAKFECILESYTRDAKKLRITNVGHSEARNVKVEIEEIPEINISNFSYEYPLINSNNSETITINFIMGNSKCFSVKTTWEDDFKKLNETTQTIQLD